MFTRLSKPIGIHHTNLITSLSPGLSPWASLCLSLAAAVWLLLLNKYSDEERPVARPLCILALCLCFHLQAKQFSAPIWVGHALLAATHENTHTQTHRHTQFFKWEMSVQLWLHTRTQLWLHDVADSASSHMILRFLLLLSLLLVCASCVTHQINRMLRLMSF